MIFTLGFNNNENEGIARPITMLTDGHLSQLDLDVLQFKMKKK